MLHGYEGANRAFLPLYPFLAMGVDRVFDQPLVSGLVLSVLCGALAVWVIERSEPLRPRTAWSYLPFFSGLGSLALYTLHTEALFLLLSALALSAGFGLRVWAAALWCALAVVTRQQGNLLALSVGLAVLLEAPTPRQGWRNVAVVGAASLGAFFSLWGFHFLTSGDPVAHLRAQSAWPHARTLGDVGRTLFAGEKAGAPFLQQTLDEQLHYVFALGWLAATLFMARSAGAGPGARKERLVLAVYCASSWVPMLLQGTFENAFRFSSVLFPLSFFCSGTLLSGGGSDRARALRFGALLVLVGLLTAVSHWEMIRFVKGQWAY
jgi:hypothetical protein